MTPVDFLHDVVDPSLTFLVTVLGSNKPSVDDNARNMMMAIAGQESNWSLRLQTGGPARSYWQFEMGGVNDVWNNKTTMVWLREICAELDIPFVKSTIFEAMAWNDTLAAVMARFLLYTDRAPLPISGQEDLSWAYYERLWRPGKPDRARWTSVYETTVKVIT